MATTTTNFGWDIPQSTDLVKDGATAIAALGQDIDTALVDLKGGTTGQVLAKASNTDLDYSWVTQDDANAIQNAQLTAKGALITAFSAGSPATLTVGNNGETLVADSSTSTGLRYQGNFAAGKNKIINGDFGIWQRGTTFNSMANASYGPDRWIFGLSGDVANITRQTFTPNDIAAIGYGDAQFFMRMEVVSSNGSARAEQKIEDVRTLSNQSVTVSFWAKASGSTSLDVLFVQNFGSGGSTQVDVTAQAISLTTSWQRFTKTFSIPSVSGKTIGSGSFLALSLRETSASTNVSFDFWGVQVEAGSVATAFNTATGTIQGELAACQRYYFRTQTGTGPGYFGVTVAGSATTTYANVIMKQTMRTSPTSIDFSGLRWQAITSSGNITNATISDATPENVILNCTTTGATAAVMNYFSGQSNTAYVGFSAEL